MKTFKRIKSFIVNRRKWLFGRPSATGLLREGKMCCLGFAMIESGATRKHIQNLLMPSDCAVGFQSQFVKKRNGKLDATLLADTAANINDDCDLENPDRERQLIRLFKRHGIKLTFTGSYEKL